MSRRVSKTLLSLDATSNTVKQRREALRDECRWGWNVDGENDGDVWDAEDEVDRRVEDSSSEWRVAGAGFGGFVMQDTDTPSTWTR